MSIFIQPQELYDRIMAGPKTTILAVFWRPEEGEGQRKFFSEHIPNSLFLDPEKYLANTPDRKAGRNPLPSIERVQQAVRDFGLTSTDDIVVYDEYKGRYAARAWWVLRWAGLEKVRILNGSLAAWMDQGFPHLGGPGGLRRPTTLQVSGGHMPVASVADVQAHIARGGLLIDAREPRRFEGKTEFLDLRAGHIPGAVKIPANLLFNANHTLKDEAEIKALFTQAGVKDASEVIVYSGSGLHSAQMIAALEHVGLTGAKLFVGGWSKWCADPNNPLVVE